MRSSMSAALACLAAAPLCVGIARSDPLAAARVAPDEMTWAPSAAGTGSWRANLVGDETKPGVYVYRARFPANYKVLPHFHPDERVVTVLSGTLYVGYGDSFDESAMKALPAGSIWTEPARASHYVWAKDGEVVIQVMGANGPSGVVRIQPK